MTMRTETDYGNWLVFGTPLPPQNEPDVPMPYGFYICRGCGKTTNYWKPGEVCAACEYEGERQQEMRDES
jgi:hypothetical protein